jgi:hypothetical protein
MTGPGKPVRPRGQFHVSGKMRTSDTHKPPGGAPNKTPALGLFRVSKHAKAKRPKSEKGKDNVEA